MSDIMQKFMRLHLATRVGWGLFLGATAISLLFALGGVPVRELVRDPAAEFNYPAYGGLLSHLGIALMFGCTAICAFAATIASGRRNVLWGAAWLSLALTLDDLFLLHEEVLPELLGLPEILLYLLYAAIAAWLALSLRREGAGIDLGGLYVAIAFLGLSVLVDVFKVHGPFSFWLEDFSKLSGYGAWLTFWSMCAHNAITGETSDNQ
ncbi:hypothetical protein C1J03_12895 [Sulfitobacter sp. SK012]|uniref:hypothetical protein n=1 Tax=Sulfitobacter sp. SK012 TaxID=1389005 RepID=UPI000E0CBD91|nr:hypothetical protein [Sulfitobacter sp. SK012]AXI46841.1 hypothetical protein C1J03_12895 [Sulfitobacter sp. SK012]